MTQCFLLFLQAAVDYVCKHLPEQIEQYVEGGKVDLVEILRFSFQEVHDGFVRHLQQHHLGGYITSPTRTLENFQLTFTGCALFQERTQLCIPAARQPSASFIEACVWSSLTSATVKPCSVAMATRSP